MELPDILAGAVGSGVDPEAMQRQLAKARPPPSLLTSLGVPDEFNDKLAQTKLAQFGPGLASAFANVVTFPHDAAYKQVDPMSPEGVNRAIDWASTMVGDGAASAGARETGLGIFGGRLAKTADLEALARAQQMEAAGGLKHSIYDATGWFKDADNQWRFEIPDNNAVINSKAAIDKRVAAHNQDATESELASILAHRADSLGLPIDEAAMHLTNQLQRPIPQRSIDLAKAHTKEDLLARAKYLEGYDPTAAPLTVDEVVTHPELKAAYPDLFTRPYHRQGGADAMFWHGAYDPGTDEFFFSKHSPASMEPSTGLHELMHGVQAREGFAPGANMGDYSPASELKYHNSAGEVESRNVQIRKDFTPLQRKQRYPWMTQDVKPKDVFVQPARPFNPGTP
jgi:hypothetical protein